MLATTFSNEDETEVTGGCNTTTDDNDENSYNGDENSINIADNDGNYFPVPPAQTDGNEYTCTSKMFICY